MTLLTDTHRLISLLVLCSCASFLAVSSSPSLQLNALHNNFLCSWLYSELLCNTVHDKHCVYARVYSSSA